MLSQGVEGGKRKCTRSKRNFFLLARLLYVRYAPISERETGMQSTLAWQGRMGGETRTRKTTPKSKQRQPNPQTHKKHKPNKNKTTSNTQTLPRQHWVVIRVKQWHAILSTSTGRVICHSMDITPLKSFSKTRQKGKPKPKKKIPAREATGSFLSWYWAGSLWAWIAASGLLIYQPSCIRLHPIASVSYTL